MGEQIPEKLCGRPLRPADVETIRREIDLADPPIRAEIARRVCRALDWTNALGQPKLMSCRVGLLRLHRAGVIELPAPTGGNGNGRPLKRAPKVWPQEVALGGSAGALTGLRLSPVTDQAHIPRGRLARRTWDGCSITRGFSCCLGFGCAIWPPRSWRLPRLGWPTTSPCATGSGRSCWRRTLRSRAFTPPATGRPTGGIWATPRDGVSVTSPIERVCRAGRGAGRH